jgi:hypothetical protein
MRSNAHQLVYEGEVYVRPIGRGIVLEEEPSRQYLDDWIELWLERWHEGIVTGGCSERLRIVIEKVPPEPG